MSDVTAPEAIETQDQKAIQLKDFKQALEQLIKDLREGGQEEVVEVDPSKGRFEAKKEAGEKANRLEALETEKEAVDVTAKILALARGADTIPVDDIPKYLQVIVQDQGHLDALEQKIEQLSEKAQGADGQRMKQVLQIIKDGEEGLKKLDHALKNKADNVQAKEGSLSQKALNELAKSLTGKDFDRLQKEERMEIGKKMWLLAHYIAEQDEFKQFSDAEKDNILALGQQGKEIVGDEEARKLEQEFGQKHGAEQEAQENEILVFLADPAGVVKRLFTDAKGSLDRVAYNKHIQGILQLKNVNVKELFNQMLHRFATGLGKYENFQKFLSTGLASADDKLRLQALQERARVEVQGRLISSQEVMDYLEGTYTFEKGKSPQQFIEGARKRLEQMKQKGASMKDMLTEARDLVDRNFPTGDEEESGKVEKQYKLGEALVAPDDIAHGGILEEKLQEEYMCTVRAFLVHQLLEEALADKGYIVLAENQPPIIDENGKVVRNLHVRLAVLETGDKTFKDGYFVDVLKGSLNPLRVVAINADERKTIFEEYQNYKKNPAKNLAIKTENGTLGTADTTIMADNMTNYAGLLLQGGDPEAQAVAKELIFGALEYNPTLSGYLQAASLSKGAERDAYLEEAFKLSEGLKEFNKNHPEIFQTFLEDQNNLMVEGVYEDFNNEVHALRQRGGSPEEWRLLLGRMYAELDSWFERSKYSEDFNYQLGYLTSLLLTSAKYLPEYTQGKISETEAAKLEKTYDALIRLGDVDVAIGQSKYDHAQLQLEKFNFDAQYGMYQELPGVATAHRAVERAAMKILVKDKGIFSRHPKEMKDAATRALRAEVDQTTGQPSWLEPRASGPYSAAEVDQYISDAVSLGFRLFYTDFTYSVRMVFGKRIENVQRFGPQKGQSLAKLADPLFERGDDLTPKEKLMIDAIGEHNVRAATRGFNDGPGMLTHRHLILQSIVRYNYLTNQALHRQMRDAHTKSGFEQEKGRLEQWLKDLEKDKRLSNIRSGTVQGGGLAEEIRKFMIKRGWNAKEMDNYYLKDLVREELNFLNIDAMRYDPLLGKERGYFQEEILANMLVYGEAMALVDAHFANSTELYELLRSAGEYAGAGGPSNDPTARNEQLELGKKINDDVYDLTEFMYERNKVFEINSGRLARKITIAEEGIRKFLNQHPGNPTAITDIKTRLDAAKQEVTNAKNALDAAKTPGHGGPNDALHAAIQQFEKEIHQNRLIYNNARTPADVDAIETAIRTAQTGLDAAQAQLKQNLHALEVVLREKQAVQDVYKKEPAAVAYTALVDAKEAAEKHVDSILAQQAKYAGNPGQLAHFSAELTKAQAAKNAIDAAFATPDNLAALATAADTARKSVFSRLRYDQILTTENWIAFNTAQRKSFDPAGAATAVRIMLNLYELKTKLVAGENNWRDIQRNMVIPGGLRDYSFTKDKNGIQRKNALRAPVSWYEKILDTNAVINGKLNLGRKKGYVLSYTDDLRELSTDDREAVGKAANKPAKSRFGDAGAAQEDVKALTARIKTPEEEKVWIEGNGNNAAYNDMDTEQERNAPWFDAAIYVQAQSKLIRLTPPGISNFLEWVAPAGIFRSPLNKLDNEFGVSKNTEQLVRWVNNIKTSQLISGKQMAKIKRKRGLGGLSRFPPFIVTFLELIGLGFITKPEQVIGGQRN